MRFRLLAISMLLSSASFIHATSGTAKEVGSGAIWFDIISADFATTDTFYTNVLGWSFRQTTAEYALIESNGTAIGGVYRTENFKSGSGVAVYITVADIEQTLSRARANGATVVMGPTATPDHQSFMAMFLDPNGRAIGLISPVLSKE